MSLQQMLQLLFLSSKTNHGCFVRSWMLTLSSLEIYDSKHEEKKTKKTNNFSCK